MADRAARSVFAELIEQAREYAGLTQAQLAEEVGLGQQAISKWESGETKPRPGMIPKLASVLGLDPNDLLVEAGYLDPPGGEAIALFDQHLSDRGRQIVIDTRDRPPTEASPTDPDPGQRRPAAASGISIPDDLDETERAILEAALEGIRARRRQARKK